MPDLLRTHYGLCKGIRRGAVQPVVILTELMLWTLILFQFHGGHLLISDPRGTMSPLVVNPKENEPLN